jgi:release factor glutamine methyltransferase
VRIVRPPGVFRPRRDTWMLAEALVREPLPAGARILDLCAGTGAVGISGARSGRWSVTAVDVSRRAVATCRINATLHGVRVRALRGDLFAPLAGLRFDAIAANPPYLPSPSDALPRRGPGRAWEAGRSGRALLDRIIDGAPRHLATGGVLMLVHSSVCGVQETLRRLAARGLAGTVVARERGRLGPIMAARAPMLRARGLLPPGGDEEELVVVRAAPGAFARPTAGYAREAKAR